MVAVDLGLWWQLPKEVIVLLPVRTWDLSSCVTGTFTELLVQSAGLGFGGFPLILFAAGALPASYLALWGPQSSMCLRKGTWGARAPWGKGSVLLGPCPTQDRDLWEELGVALSVPAGCSKEPTDLLLCRPPQKASTHGGWGLRELDHLSFLPSAPIHLECRETSWYFSFAVGWGVESVPPPLAWPLTVPQPRPAGRPGAQHSGWQPHRQLSPPLPLGGWRYACVRWSSFCFISGQPGLQVSA